MELTAEEAAGAHIRFPGIFNESYAYINGAQVAKRENYKVMWWHNDYGFEWDVDTAGKLKAGKNVIIVRCINPHHFGGIFRRPFLYKPVGEE